MAVAVAPELPDSIASSDISTSMVYCLPGNTAPIRIARRDAAPGPILIEAHTQHLIVVHASRTTWTTCRDTGARHLRRSGHVDVIPAGTVGGYDAASPCTSWILSLSPDVLNATMKTVTGQSGRAVLEPMHMLDRPRIARLAVALQVAQAEESQSEQIYLDAMAHAVASQLIGFAVAQPEERHSLPKRRVTHLLDFIENRLDGRLTIDALAREAGASSSALRQWFKQTMGVSVHHYVMQRRVARARQLLQHSDLPLSQVALIAGFAHQSHMARWMHRELGQAPLAVRRAGSGNVFVAS